MCSNLLRDDSALDRISGLSHDLANHLPLTLGGERHGPTGATWDRFYKAHFRPKTFRSNFHPQIYGKFLLKNIRYKFSIYW
jgi:hypothetical protein